MCKDVQWCSFVHLIPKFGGWYEQRYGEICKLHDLERAEETRRRGLGISPKWLPGACDIRFFWRMAKRGPFDILVAMPSYLAVATFYWPNRIRKKIQGKVMHV